MANLPVKYQNPDKSMTVRELAKFPWHKLADMMSVKERRFVLAWQGNIEEAATIAGYSPLSAFRTGKALLNKPWIKAALEKRCEANARRYIATREERQAFWTSIMYGEPQASTVETADGFKTIYVSPDLKDRLKAAELLGRSEADFLDRLKVDATHKLDLASAMVEAADRRRKMLNGKQTIDITPKGEVKEPFEELAASDPFEGCVL